MLGLRFADDPVIPATVPSLGENTYTSTQTAPAFVGDGSSLTNLPVPGGVATLGANIFTGTQVVNLGNLDLDASTAGAGNLTKNGDRFLHNFSNGTFLGLNAGNFTMTGCCNTASGAHALRTWSRMRPGKPAANAGR
jgi:hypothetical protein